MKLVISIFLLSLGSFALGQIAYQERIEFELKDDYEDEEIIEFGSYGFIMSSKNSNTNDGQREWRYEHYDSSLELVKGESVLLPSKLYEDETYANEDRMHTLYKDRKGNFSLVSVEASDLSINRVDGRFPKKLWVIDMAILGDYAFFKARVKKSTFLYSINWKNGEKNIIPVIIDNVSKKKTSLLEFQTMEESNEVFAYVKAVVRKGESDIYVMRLNDQGEKVGIFKLTEEVNKNIVDISASQIDESTYIYSGTYSSNSTSSSEGLFFCQAQNDEIEFIEYYNFLDLNNFLSYLPAKKQAKIAKKKKKKEKRGKEFVINYRIAAHEVMPLDDGYLFLGEAYYPTYRSETYTTTSTVNGVTSTTTQTRQVFDGYQYTHAMLGKFSKNGNLLWDQTFELRSTYKPYFVKRFISVGAQDENSIKLVFSSYNRIVAKNFDYDGNVLMDYRSEEIETNFYGDEMKSSFSNVDYWYDNYFIAYGKQKIKNKEDNEKTKRKRKVYFISKVQFQ